MMWVRRKHWLLVSASCSALLLLLVLGGTRSPLYLPDQPLQPEGRRALQYNSNTGEPGTLSPDSKLDNQRADFTSVGGTGSKPTSVGGGSQHKFSNISSSTSRSKGSSDINNEKFDNLDGAGYSSQSEKRKNSSSVSTVNSIKEITSGGNNAISVPSSSPINQIYDNDVKSNNLVKPDAELDKIMDSKQILNQKNVGSGQTLSEQEQKSSSSGNLMELTITDVDQPPKADITPSDSAANKKLSRSKPKLASNNWKTSGIMSPHKSSQMYQHLLQTGVSAARYRVTKEYLKKFPGDINFNPGSVVSRTTVKKILILTTWRSGSTFLGDIFNSYPGTFYSFEPLHDLLEKRHFQDGPLKPKVISLLKNIMNCEMGSAQSNYFEYMKNNTFLLGHNSRYWQSCSINRAICFDHDFFNQVCSLMPVNVLKTVRLGVQPVEELMEDTSLDLRVVHLVRDPRGTMHSRRKLDWCRAPVCSDPKVVCQDLKEDLGHAYKLQAKYPDRFLTVRYEDLGTRPEEMVHLILDFVGLSVTESVKKFISEHTKLDEQKSIQYGLGVKTRNKSNKRRKPIGAYSTFRNSRSTTFAWRSHSNFSTVAKIQDACSHSLRLLNLKVFETEEEFRDESISILLPE